MRIYRAEELWMKSIRRTTGLWLVETPFIIIADDNCKLASGKRIHFALHGEKLLRNHGQKTDITKPHLFVSYHRMTHVMGKVLMV